MKKVFVFIKNLIFPKKLKCDCCDAEIKEAKNKSICDECYNKLPFISNACVKCGEKIEGGYNICYNCKTLFMEFDKNYSVFEYSGLAKDMVWKLKYENCKYLAETMAGFITDLIVNNNIKFDLITFVPISKNKRIERGYNQAEELAKVVSVNLSAKYIDTLSRIKEPQSQVELTRAERFNNIKNNFIVKNKSLIRNKNILIIDDVLTTGATLSETARVLKRSGADKVTGITFANTTKKIKFEKISDEKNDKI